jgi:hypothetical protein
MTKSQEKWYNSWYIKYEILYKGRLPDDSFERTIKM